jgi:hypothetical protein
MSTIARWGCAALSAIWSASALACGVCIEDKVAATYDHAVVMRAAATHKLMVFGEISGPVDMKEAMSKITRTAPKVRGIDRRSVRTSLSPSAFSFALDATKCAPDAAVAELQKRLQIPGATLVLLQVMSSGTTPAGK